MIEWNGWYKVKDTTDFDSGYSNDFVWLIDTLGPPNANSRWFYDFDSHVYYFRNKNDALMYELGWTHATST
jgi:hypothetical protein